MKVLLSATALRGTGSMALGKAVTEALEERNDVELTSWVPRAWGLPATHAVSSGFASKIWHENVSIRVDARRHDVLFSLGDTGTPVAAIPHLLLVQQAYLAYPQDEWGFDPSPRLAAKMRAITTYFSIARRGVTRFTVQTEDMRQKLGERWSIDVERIDVTPSSVLPLPDLEPISVDKPYVACVTSAGEHKNLDVLPEMLAAMQSDLDLWVTLSPSQCPKLVSRARQLGVSHRIAWLGPVRRSVALSVLSHAELAVLPATLESFGFAYYEAMSVGCPVVAADRGFAREACADAALYASEARPESFAERVDEIAGRRDEIGRRGLERFRRNAWTWARVGNAYVDQLGQTIREHG